MTRRRRLYLKIIHWLMVPLFIWFLVIGPPQAHALGKYGFLVHSNLALVFVILCIGWTIDFVVRGLATTRTPKLPNWAKRVHWWMHRLIIWGLFAVALGGFLLGLTSNRLLKAGGFLPIAPPQSMHQANAIIGDIHILQFYALGGLIGVHAVFHIWRHYKVKDNALKVMLPKMFHKYL
ncbi:MAG: cytochrome b/b6 domain-containing protein [Alphaproteobacteria bacterium]